MAVAAVAGMKPVTAVWQEVEVVAVEEMGRAWSMVPMEQPTQAAAVVVAPAPFHSLLEVVVLELSLSRPQSE